MQELFRAVDLALAGEWDQAHKIVQSIETPTACWIHAVLHKIEGDMGNSRYWYARAGDDQHIAMKPDEELRLIRSQLE